MPIYEYRCEKCGHEFEVWQKVSDPEPKGCPECHGRRISRLISHTSFQLKGTGWYVTDYGRGSGGRTSKKNDQDSATENKTDTTSKAETASKTESLSKTDASSKTAHTPAA